MKLLYFDWHKTTVLKHPAASFRRGFKDIFKKHKIAYIVCSDVL